jgi:hypothetical protein
MIAQFGLPKQVNFQEMLRRGLFGILPDIGVEGTVKNPNLDNLLNLGGKHMHSWKHEL